MKCLAQNRRRQWHPTPVLLPGKPHGWRSLEGCCPWGRWGLDTTDRLHFHFSLACIGEGNGNPLQCSCLENPRDGGAWWAAVYGVTQSRTWLKRLGSSGSSFLLPHFPRTVIFTLLLPWNYLGSFLHRALGPAPRVPWSLFVSKANLNITVIQAYAPTSNDEEAEVEWFY